MPRYEDLTGRVFGRLTVLEATDQKNKDGRRIWKCQCECGNIKFTTSQNLKRGDCTSCGCKNKEQITALGRSHALNLINQKFGKLTVIERAKNKLPYSDSIAWICKCDCGNIIIVPTGSLRSGNTTSCGCKKSQGEENIQDFLNSLNISYEQQKWFSDLKSDNNKPLQFDFYLPKYNSLIEFDGEQHYIKNRYSSKEQFERDCKKNLYCLQHQYHLYRIPYSEKNNIQTWTSLSDLLNEKFLVEKVNHYNIQY